MTYSCACNQLSRNGDRTGSRRGFVFVAAFVIRLFKADRVVGEKERRREGEKSIDVLGIQTEKVQPSKRTETYELFNDFPRFLVQTSYAFSARGEAKMRQSPTIGRGNRIHRTRKTHGRSVSGNGIKIPINWRRVRRHYDERVKTHKKLLELYLHRRKSWREFVNLALGIDDPTGNYSAADHGLGPKILSNRKNWDPPRQVIKLAGEFKRLKDAKEVPELIWQANITCLKIGVGSEMSCMVNPEVCWVANRRTIWTHLFFKHKYDVSRADELLTFYRDDEDLNSKMAYSNWAAIHRELPQSLTEIAQLGKINAREAGIACGNITYLWADAIAASLYGKFHDKRKRNLGRSPS